MISAYGRGSLREHRNGYTASKRPEGQRRSGFEELPLQLQQPMWVYLAVTLLTRRVPYGSALQEFLLKASNCLYFGFIITKQSSRKKFPNADYVLKLGVCRTVN